MPAAGLNNGDHDLFINDDGTCYLAFTDWRTKGTIVVEQLTEDYLSGTGKVAASITPGKTEAPALFKRKRIYSSPIQIPTAATAPGQVHHTGLQNRRWDPGLKANKSVIILAAVSLLLCQP